MGERLKYLMLPLAIIYFAFTALAGEDTKASLEQVYIEKPQIYVYGQDLNLDQESEYEAFLGGEKLQLLKKQKFSESGEGVYYYVLLDVSNSMPNAYFQEIKNAISNFEGKLGSNEHLVLYTFGQEVKQVLEENHTKSDTEKVLSGIKNVDNKTLLFEAISRAANDSQQAADDTCKRKVIMVISDGEDFATGKTMSEEALENLKQKGIPAFAFGIEATSRENLNNFGEFARKSGGALTIFNERQAEEAFLNFHNMVLNSDELCFSASSNLVSNKIETFALNISPKNEKLTREVMVSRWIKDDQSPQIVRIENVSDHQIEVEFSKDVEGIESASNYTIRKGKLLFPVSVAGKSNERTAILTVSEKLKPGDYEVTCSGIADISMEKNPVSNSMSFHVDSPQLWTRILSVLREWVWIPVILVMSVLIFLIVFIYRKIKKSKGILYTEQGIVMASETEIHKHVSIQEKQGKEFQLTVSINGNNAKTLSLSMVDSFIIGRSKICNLYFDDTRMSKQHFVIEWNGENMFVSDLNTTNGTLLNNIPIASRRKIEKEDVISAGSTEFKIRW